MENSSLPDAGKLGGAERGWRAAACLGWPLALGAAPVLTALGDIQLCAFRQLSGRPCPLCGGTHACAALAEGDFGAAWQANPGLLPLFAVAAAHTLQLAYEALSGRRLGNQLLWKRAWGAGGVFLLAAWLVRLLPF